eukprot:3672366-Amphidinium_carterae.1
MPTTIAIFSDVDVEAPPSLLQTPAKRPNRNESIQTSGSKTTAASPHQLLAEVMEEEEMTPPSEANAEIRCLARVGTLGCPVYQTSFGTSGAGGTGGGPSDGSGGGRGDDSFDTFGGNGPPYS